MSTSTHSFKLSYDRTFDDMADRRPLLFRLHELNSETPATFFDAEQKIILASRYAPTSKDNSEDLDLPKSLDETSSLTLDEASVAKHVTRWKEENAEPSEFISLTFNVLWVFWEWKRRMSRAYKSVNHDLPGFEFVLFVLESSELRGRCKLATEVLKRENYREGYNFARSAEEVIVSKVIHKEAILGTKPLSMLRLQGFVPSWWKKPLEVLEIIRSENGAFESFNLFQSRLNPPAATDDCVRQSLRFAMALLAPLLVPNLQMCADNERIVESTGRAIDCSQAGGVNTKVDPSNDNTPLRERKVEGGERSGSPETGSLLAGTGTGGDGPRNAPPAKRRRVSEDEQTPRKNEDTALAGSTDSEPSLLARPTEWKYVCWLAADVWCQGMDEPEESRKEFERKCADHARGLLERYRSELGTCPKEDDLEILSRVMDLYKSWVSDTTKE